MAKKTRLAATAEPDWLERDQGIIEGIDHLGTQVVSVNLYGLLIPGVTNVTDRARYFSLYPWVVHRFAQDASIARTKKGWREFLRSIDYAYALSCASLERVSDGEIETAGVVGITKARNEVKGLAPDARVELASGCALDAHEKVPTQGAYFKNPEGGYGQYYKGPLGVLGVSREGETTPLDRNLSTYAGLPIAECLDRNRAFGDLLALARAGSGTLGEFAQLGELLHPGALVDSIEERDVLRHLVLGDDDALCRGQRQIERNWRRLSLTLMLSFVRDAGKVPDDFVTEFRWACAAKALPDGSPWVVDEGLRGAQEGWGAYHRNDTLSFVLESVFLVALRTIKTRSLTPRALADVMAREACDRIVATDDTTVSAPIDGSVADWIRACERPATSGNAWDETSTWTWTEHLVQALDDEDDARTLQWCARLLGRLASDRGAFEHHPFEHIPGAVEMAQVHAVQLGQWYARVRERSSEPARTFFEALLLEWVIYRHLRVATRKLANQGASTFKFRPELGRCVLSVEENEALPMPTFTNPRVRQSRVIMQDLGLLRVDDDHTVLTDDGRAWLEAAR